MLNLLPRNLNRTSKVHFPFIFHDQIQLDIKIRGAKDNTDSQNRTTVELDACIWHHGLETPHLIAI